MDFEIELNADDQKVLRAADELYYLDWREDDQDENTAGWRMGDYFTDIPLSYDWSKLVNAGLMEMRDATTFKEYRISRNGMSIVTALSVEKPIAHLLPNRMWKKSGTIRQSFRTVLVEIEGRKYDMNRITESSFKRLRAVLNDSSVEKSVELDDYDLTPTVYFYYGVNKK